MMLMIDNYDSFTYNLVQYLGELGEELLVKRNDRISLTQITRLRPSSIVISPGPGRPSDAGVFGGEVVRAKRPMHGKTSRIYHTQTGLLQGLPNPFEATRYHSLIVKRETLPKALTVTAWTADEEVMGLQHRVLPLYGVQFHPESILTAVGKDLLKNFLALARAFHRKRSRRVR
ncbi:MAG: aminodeoxychorismate/anthranilate synthase component II [Candidatus Omnitrophica bacterium]|nr:aminodeoxychorismate/anthranilate synthase component II [Candidatus Omnitrophota bacterium]